MAITELAAMNRRMTIGGALAGVAGLALPLRQASGRVVIQRGMVGGGLVQFEESLAHFSLFASRLTFEPEKKEVILGSVSWVDTKAELSMASVSIADYIVPDPQPSEGKSRQILGTMSVNGEGNYPFELVVTALGIPGSGEDSVHLMVGDGAPVSDSATPASGFGFSYIAAGQVISGDIQDLDLRIDPMTGIVESAEE